MASAFKILPHYTYDDYCRWEGQWELIDGIPHAMSPAPSPTHQKVSARLKYELTDAMIRAGCQGCSVYDFIDVKISEDTILQPDALIVSGEISKPYLDFPAALVAEVLSPATAIKDRNTKHDLYQHFGISYYLIVDTDKKEIEVFQLANGQYKPMPREKKSSIVFEVGSGCAIEVSLHRIWE